VQLPKVPKADQLVYAARLYRAALEMIENRPDIAYLLLISTVESLANVAFSDYQPEESEKLQTKPAVQQLARYFGLNEEQAKQLALAACETDRWLKKKFKKFVLDFASLDEETFWQRTFIIDCTRDCCLPPAGAFSETGMLARSRPHAREKSSLSRRSPGD
jgi:hypothetical protein